MPRHAWISASHYFPGIERSTMDPTEVCSVTRHVKACSLLCYWAVREIGVTETALARHLNVSQPAIAQAVSRGERIAAEKRWNLEQVLRGIL